MTTVVILCKVFGRGLDLVVVGAGPAGLAAAVAAAALGMRVVCIAPDPRSGWHANYAAWADELGGYAARCVEHSWPNSELNWSDRGDADQPHRLARGYARLDRVKLQRELLARADALGCEIIDARVVDIEHRSTHSKIEVAANSADGGPLAGGRSFNARTVIDASGADSSFIRRVDQRKPAFQTAYGLLVDVRSHPYALDTMTFMDLRSVGEGPPSFLYAMPLGPQRLFVEETSLALRPAMSLDRLKRRLNARLAANGIEVTHTIATERCVIPMGVAPPRSNQRTIAFGAAAAMVHPATGYQLARSLNAAPCLAEAIARGLDEQGPSLAAANGYATIWPEWQRRCWELYTFGMEALCRFDGTQLRAFMRAFFQLPEPIWRGYLAAELSLSALSKAMWDVFSAADSTLRWRLVQLSTGGGARRLIGALSVPDPL